MLSDTQILRELEAMGTEQNRKIYKRHGVGDNMYGVSYADLKKLKKKVKINHDAALKLWATGNHDARIFATMIADPKQATDTLLDKWVHDLRDYLVADALTGYIAQTGFARAKMETWTADDGEWIGTVGWNLLTHLAMHDDMLPEAFFEPYLATIERELHQRKNRVRYAMNNALIAIGLRSPALEARATGVARHLGKVHVDHGETNCKTPDAIAYINKAKARKQV
jgi:3-methyladenine DNA glycosylase AlkD